MKISVIIAIFHMSMGIIVKGLNAIYRGEMLTLFFEVILGLVVFWGLFGWMDFLIFAKWTFPVNAYLSKTDDPTNFRYINTSPSIISTMINNFLSTGNQYVNYNDGTDIVQY